MTLAADPTAPSALRDPLAVARAATYERWRSEGRSEWIPAAGTSMEPLVHPGDELLVEFGRPRAGLGEILLVRRDGRLVAHRLVARRAGRAGGEPSLVTKGDAEPLLDRSIGADDVLGVVRSVRRPSGRVVRLGATPGARLAARVSWWTGRAASWTHRRTQALPAPLRGRALPLLLTLSQLPLRFVLAPIART